MKVQISIKSLIKESFALFKENILILLGLIFGGIVFSLLLSIPSTFQIGGTAGYIASNIVSMVFQVIFSGMFIKYCLQAIKGNDPGFREILPTIAQCIKLLVYSLLIMILYIPYFYLALSKLIPGMPGYLPSWLMTSCILLTLASFYLVIFRLWPVVYLILDKNYGIFDSIKKSWIITQGNQLSMLKIILLFFLFFIVGLILLIIGVFVAIAFLMLLYTLFYTKIASQLNIEEE